MSDVLLKRPYRPVTTIEQAKRAPTVDDFLVYATNHVRHPNACQYYRIDVPLRSLEDMGYAFCWNDRSEQANEDSRMAMLTYDIVQMYSVGGDGAYHQAKTIAGMKPARRDDGKVVLPPSVVYDVDDNTDYVHPFNQTFNYLGVRTYPDGKLLEPGDWVSYNNAANEEVVLWKDGITTGSQNMEFDIKRNLYDMKVRHELIRTCHGSTVSSTSLASYFRDVIGANDVYVFPNSVIPSDYESFDLVPKPELRILWQGSMSHLVDWWPLRDAIGEVARRYPAVKWVIFGTKFDWVLNTIPASQLEHQEWVEYPAYKLKRALLQIDINLCPLADNPFNRCKSGIKWYEASICDRPEATLASRVKPYSEEILDGETGLLYSTPEEFVEKLSLLIEQAELRQRLAAGARAWVLANRTPAQTVPGLWDFYQHLRRKLLHDYFLSSGASRTEIQRLAAQQGLAAK